MEISENEKKILLNCARESIRNYIFKLPPPNIKYDNYPSLKENYGAFVTLNLNDKLRGCIGYIISPMPLFETVSSAAQQAAFCDPRFLPLVEEELEKISIEISVLSKPAAIKNYDEIKIGEHGLLLDYNGLKAILLPQVAVHNNYNTEQFMSALFDKAGIGPYLWEEKFIPLNIFSANVFSEEEKRGENYEQN